jgi:hypothetical protein
LRAFELNAIDNLVGLLLGKFNRFAQRRDAQHPTAAGKHLLTLQGGAGVKNLGIV